MNWLRHELRLQAHKIERAIHLMTRSVKSWSEARNHETKFQFMTHSVKSFYNGGIIIYEKALAENCMHFIGIRVSARSAGLLQYPYVCQSRSLHDGGLQSRLDRR
jgi:hypothetical protein